MIGVRQDGEIGNPKSLPFDPPGAGRGYGASKRDTAFQHAPRAYPSSRPRRERMILEFDGKKKEKQ
jgi:hypothetical protein